MRLNANKFIVTQILKSIHPCARFTVPDQLYSKEMLVIDEARFSAKTCLKTCSDINSEVFTD